MNTAKSMSDIGRLVEFKGRMNESDVRKSIELVTDAQVREYAGECKTVAAAGMLYAVLNAAGVHMADSMGRLLYSANRDNMGGSIAVSKDALETLGYSEDIGWPCALLMGIKAPLYVDEISEAAMKVGIVVEQVADAAQTQERIAKRGKGKVGSEEPVKVFDEVVHCETAGTDAQKHDAPRVVDRKAEPVALIHTPRYTATEKKAIAKQQADFMKILGMTKTGAYVAAVGVLRMNGTIRSDA